MAIRYERLVFLLTIFMVILVSARTVTITSPTNTTYTELPNIAVTATGFDESDGDIWWQEYKTLRTFSGTTILTDGDLATGADVPITGLVPGTYGIVAYAKDNSGKFGSSHIVNPLNTTNWTLGNFNSPTGIGWNGTHLLVAHYNLDITCAYEGYVTTGGLCVSTSTAPTDYSRPGGLTFNDTHIFVNDWGGFGMKIFDMKTLELVRVVTGLKHKGIMWNGTNIITSSGKIVYVWNEDLSASIQTINVGGSDVRGLTWNGTHMFTIDRTTDDLRVFDGVSNTLVRTFIDLEANNDQGLFWNGELQRLMVGTGGSPLPIPFLNNEPVIDDVVYFTYAPSTVTEYLSMVSDDTLLMMPNTVSRADLTDLKITDKGGKLK